MSSSLVRRRDRIDRQNRSRQIRKILGIGVFSGIVIAVVLAVVVFLTPVFSTPASGVEQNGNTKVINIQAGMDGFDMQTIRVQVGENVKVNLRSLDNEHHTDGGGKHQFAIDELGVNIVAQPMSVSSGTFVAKEAGTYTFYCDICCGGKANPTMNGKLIVEA